MSKYEKFVLTWMIEHGHTIPEMICYMEEYKNKCMPADAKLLDVFDMWAYEEGFNGEVWPCYDEWEELEAMEV